MTRTEKAIEASFALQVWTRERNCVACGEPGSNAHHVLFGSHGRTQDPRGGVMLCGSGTIGCHGLFHEGDEKTRREIGEYILDRRPDTIEFMVEQLGSGRAVMEYLDRVYCLADGAILAAVNGNE